MITVNIAQRKITFSRQEQGLATGANARAALKPEFQSAISARTTKSRAVQTLSQSALERMIVKYSEQLVFQPLHEIRHWFTYRAGAYIEPGYPPLFYSRGPNRTVSANKSAVATAGEGIAGFLAQRMSHCAKLPRPNHDYPDIVMESNSVTYLDAAKATLSSDIQSMLHEELPRMASLVSSAGQLDSRSGRDLLIGTQLESEVQYRCSLIALALV